MARESRLLSDIVRRLKSAKCDLVSIVLSTAGALAAATYLDAKFHLRHDLHILTTAGASPSSLFYIWCKIRADRMTTFHVLEDQSRRIPNQLFLIFEGRT